MRRPRGLLIGLVVALTASVAAVVGAAAPAFATVSGVVVSPLSPTEGTALPNTTTVMHFSSNTPDISSLSATIDWGDGTGATPGSIAATGPATYSVQGGHTYTDEGSFTVTVTVNDSSDASSGAGVTTATVAEGDSLTADSPLTITPLEGNNFKHGAVATFTDTNTSATVADFTASIDWGDGTTSSGAVSGFTGGPFTVSGSHTYTQDGPYNLTVTLSDDAPGTATATAHPTANVGEAAFSATGVGALSSTEGQVFSGTVGTFTDPGSDDPASEYTGSINWGDGTTTNGTVTGAAGSYSVSGTHTYADEGTFTVVTKFSENSDPLSTIPVGATITVAEGDVLTGHPITFSATQGSPFTGTVATFSDTFTGNVPGDFTAQIDWGDGTTTAGTVTEPSPGTYSVSGTHTYALIGSKSVTVSLTDDAPGTATASAGSTANVASNCTTTIQNSTVSKVTLGPGTTCLKNATVSRTVIVPVGASIVITDSRLNGGLTGRNPAAVTVCHSTVSGNVNISRATGFVLLGDPGDDSCLGNTFLRGVTLTSNTGGLELGHNDITRSVSVRNNSGPGPAAEDVGTEIEANTIGRNLSCSGNTPVAINDGQPNSVTGVATGECSPPF